MHSVWKDGVWSAEVELHRTANNGISGMVVVSPDGQPYILIASMDTLSSTTYYHRIP